jgi:hypothetical protein
MNFRRLLVVLLAVAMVLGVGAGIASASQPYGGCGGCGGIPFYYPFYAQYGQEHIPYFALHPPVYYSYPVPRTYGYSPFAYPLGSPTPEIEFDAPKPEKKPEPKTMNNPHVKEVSHAEHTVQAAPKVIYNPFVAAPRVAEARD